MKILKKFLAEKLPNRLNKYIKEMNSLSLENDGDFWPFSLYKGLTSCTLEFSEMHMA